MRETTMSERPWTVMVVKLQLFGSERGNIAIYWLQIVF